MSDVDDTEELEQQGEDTIPAVDPEPPKREWTDEDAAEAKAFGWKAPEEWAGEKPDGYIDDPRRYMDRANNFRPFRALREQLESTKRDFQTRTERLEAINAKTMEQQRANYERDMAAIKAAQREAVDNADGARFDALERQREAIPKPVDIAPAERPEPVSTRPPELDEYVKANDWVNNPILRQAGAQLIDAMGYAGKPVKEQLEFAEREVRKLYPGAFAPAVVTPQTTQKAAIQRVDGGGLGGGNRADAFSALPAEAKASFKRFAAQGIFTDTPEDRKRYADDYNA